MSTSRITLIAFLVLAFTGAAIADDIKLKSGETLKDVEVVRTKGDKMTVKLMNGKRKTIKLIDIADHVKKETPAQVFKERAKKLKRKDVQGMMELVNWGMDRGVTLEAKKLLAKVIRVDKEHAEARAMLGHEKCSDGKWRYGKSLERFREKELAKKYEAMGWQKVDGKFVDPFTARRLKAGWIEHDGMLRPKKIVDRMKRGEFFLEGQWYEKKDKELIAQKKRKVGGSWKDISDLDTEHKSKENPWNLASDHVRVYSHVSHGLNMRLLEELESSWGVLVKLCGDAPLAQMPNDKLTIHVGKNGEAYGQFGGQFAHQDRAAMFSSCTGGFYSPSEKRGYTYYHSEDYLFQWCRGALAQMFMSRLHDYDKLPSPAFDMVAAYIEGHKGEKYWPNHNIYRFAFENGKHKFQAPQKVVEGYGMTTDMSAPEKEGKYGRLGYVLHYLNTKHPKIVAEWMRGFLTKGDNVDKLFKMVKKVDKACLTGDALNAFAAEYYKAKDA